jgi:hypothetical protein
MNGRPSGFRSPITYANVTATIALVAALGGGAYAASNAPKNSVDSKSVENESLTGKDVKGNSLTGGDISEDSLGEVPSAAGVPAGSITGADVADDSLAGVDVNESSLGQVPQAANAAGVSANSITGGSVADNSLGGGDIDESSLSLPAAPSEVTPISRRQVATTGFQTLFEGNGLRVEAECNGASGLPQVRYDLLEAGSMEQTVLFSGQNPVVNGFAGPANDTGFVGGGFNSATRVEATWRRDSDGKTVTIDLGSNATAGVGTDCVWAGTAAAE